MQAFENFHIAEASCVLKMNAFSIIRAFAFLKNVTFFLKEFKSLNLNSFYTFLTLTFSEDKFLKGNEQEGFLVMSYNELCFRRCLKSNCEPVSLHKNRAF